MIIVLIVDDYLDWRRTVRELIQGLPELQVVCEVSDGVEAVQKAGELKPDLILLDIGLPKLNGIKAARQIRQVSPSSKIIFLSQENSLEVTQVALSTGALGYVYKARAQIELLPAIDAALRGEQFVTSMLKGYKLTDAPGAQAPRRHELLVFYDDTILLDGFARFIAAALKADNAAIALVTKSRQGGLLQRLRAEGVEIDVAIQQGTFILLDVAETLSTVMVDDLLDPVRVFEGFSRLIETASKAAKAAHPRVAICCQCKGSLWGDGKTDAAIQLEQCCNELAKTHEVDLLCAYPASGFRGGQDDPIIQSIYAEHSAVHSR